MKQAKSFPTEAPEGAGRTVEFCDLTLKQAIEGLSKKDFSPQELAQSCLGRIREREKDLNAFISVFEEKAVSGASKGNFPKPLLGVPYAAKDNISTKGFRTTAGSKILDDYIPPYDAMVIQRLSKAGGFLLGKTNLDEFAMGSSTENSAYGVTRNPHDLSRVPGGSSGGSAAVVATGEVIFALGSDTGGSVRQPASFCGVVGFKPTYGRVSRYGLIAMASSLDQIGPITKSVEDAELVYQIIAGHDPYDSTTVKIPKTNSDKINKDSKIGLPKEYFPKDVDADVKKAVLGAVSLLEKEGFKVEEVSLPTTAYCIPTYYLIVPSEVSSNLARYDGVRYGPRILGNIFLETLYKTRTAGFGNEAKRRIMLGTFALSSGYYEAYYLKAAKVRTKISQEFASVFEKVDFLITPTAPTPAFKIGEKQDPLSMYLSDIFTIPSSLAGLPAISIPCGDVRGLPIGLQIIGPKFSDERVLSFAKIYEKLK